MEIKIGHYGQNITPTEAKTGGINSPDIIDEQGIGVSAVKSKEIWKKPRQTTELCGNKHNTTRVEIGIGHYRRNIGLKDETKGLNQRKLNGEDSECTSFGKKALRMKYFNAQATEC